MFGVSHVVPIQSASDAQDSIKYGFTAGTYIGLGGATARIINTGLEKVHSVWITRERHGYTTATANGGVYACHAARAAGTPSSFYPFVAYIPSNAAAIPTAALASAGTFKWLALGEFDKK